MNIPFFHRLYVRIWLAVVLAVLVLSLLVGWLLRTQADRIRAERLAEVPAREVLIRNSAGEVIGKTTVQPVRVPGRGIEFHIQLPAGVQGGEQLAVSLPPRPRAESAGAAGGRDGRWWSIGGGTGPRSSVPSFSFVMLLIAFAVAVAAGSYPVVRRLTKRLEHLQKGVERLGAGDLRARVDASGKDEAAYLAQRFNLAADRIEALVQSQKSLLANASHELRSPLARIRMGLELIESSPSAALKAELARNIAELDTLIDEILLASRLETQSAAAVQAQMEPVDVLALAAEECSRVHAELALQGQASDAQISADARLLRRLIRNLLENAQRHGEKDVSLTVTANQYHVLIEVADRGLGVAQDEQSRIFEPFYRSKHASEGHGGVGLGLSLVRSIARQHGGDVSCEMREGGGARFLVTLPKKLA